MKKYKLTDNISFLASVMRQASKASFVFVLLRIPLEVIIPYIGIWFPNLIVRAIEESVNRTQLFTQAAVLGGLLVVLSLVNQYGKGIVSAESAYVRMKLTDMLNDHLMDCNYDMLGDKKVMQSLSQASQRIWSNTGFLVNAGENTVAFFSAVAGRVSCGVVKASILGNPSFDRGDGRELSDIRLWRKDTTEAQRLFW